MLKTGVAVVVTHMLLSGIHGLFKMLFVLFVFFLFVFLCLSLAKRLPHLCH